MEMEKFGYMRLYRQWGQIDFELNIDTKVEPMTGEDVIELD